MSWLSSAISRDMDLRVPPSDEMIRHETGGVLISRNVRPKWRLSIRARFLDSSKR